MNYESGRLVEISPWGTGFIQSGDHTRYGFHASMLTPAKSPSASLPTELEDRRVFFRTDGPVVLEVLLESADDSIATGKPAVPHKATA